MTVANNAATRLHEVLSDAFGRMATTDSLSVGMALQASLGVQSMRDAHTQVGLMSGLVRDIRVDVDDQEMSQQYFVDPWWSELSVFLERVAADGMSMNGTALRNGGGWLSDNALASLAACGELLTKHSGRLVLTDDQLTRIRQAVADLRERVSEADNLDTHLRAVLLDHLADMDGALAYVRLYGPEGLARVVAQGFGEWVVSATPATSSPEDEIALQGWKVLLLQVAGWVGYGKRVVGAAGLDASQALSAVESVTRTLRELPSGEVT